MKLYKAINIAKQCELSTVGEAIDNIKIHCMNIFDYDEINKEIDELMNDFNNSELSISTDLDDVKVRDLLISEIIKNKENNVELNGVSFEDVFKFLHCYGLTYLPELRDILNSLEEINNSSNIDELFSEYSEEWKELKLLK